MKRLGCAAALFTFAAVLSPAWAEDPVPPAGRLLDFSAAELQRIQRHGPWPPAKPEDPGNRLADNPQAIALGQRLFFDPRLSLDGTLSCASCHAPEKAFSDGRSKAMGRSEVDRNTPTLWNAGFERWLGWDGATDSLWSQAIRALTHPQEMASSPARIASTIAADPDLTCRWQQLFGNTARGSPESTMVNAAKAIGAFNASLVSGQTPFDEFRDAMAQGDATRASRYPVSAQRGLKFFIGRGQCFVCHTGPLFSNGEFGDIGRPFFKRPGEVDSGRHGGIQALLVSQYNLLSQWADRPAMTPAAGSAAVVESIKTRQVQLQHRNFGEFKVPSLRNVERTKPYMHDGQLASLEAVVTHYSSINLERLHADGEQILKPLKLSAPESADLVAFLRTLTDAKANQWQPQPSAPCR